MFLDPSNWIGCVTLMNLNKLIPSKSMAEFIKIERPDALVCRICRKTFLTREILIAHKRVIHDIPINVDI
jgi:hypothetical protein